MKLPEYVAVKITPNDKATAYSLEVIPNADFVNVVRCKDCKWRNWETNGCDRNPCIEPWWENDFCNYGEKEMK